MAAPYQDPRDLLPPPMPTGLPGVNGMDPLAGDVFNPGLPIAEPPPSLGETVPDADEAKAAATRAMGMIEQTDENREMIVSLLQQYIKESEDARKTGLNARDLQWESNMNLYWGRFDFTGKAEWQSRRGLPEGGVYVDRFAAAMRRALVKAGEDWYEITDLLDDDGLTEAMLKRWMDYELGRSGRNKTGHPVSFHASFEEIIKSGALMTLCCSVTWKDGLRIEPVDPREVFLDHTGRRLYRRRRYTVDRNQIDEFREMADPTGKPIYDGEALSRLRTSVDSQQTVEKEASSGTGQQTASPRDPYYFDEFLCTLIDKDGRLLAKNQLCVLANGIELVRWPEPNPFWHGQDWIISHPMVTVPFAPYGKSYIETWGELVIVLDDLMNLILDGAFTQMMNARAARPDLLKDPSQLKDGISPGKTFLLTEECEDPRKAIITMDLGEIEPRVIDIWSGIKNELQEGANQSEVTLGQLPNKASTTATAVESAQGNSSALVESIAGNTEENLLDPMLQAAFVTCLQHFDPAADPSLAAALGPEMTAMLMARRQEFKERPYRFCSRGISGVIERGKKVRQLLAMLQIVGQNELLMQAYLAKYDIGKTLDEILRGMDVDPTTLAKPMGVPGLSSMLQPGMPPMGGPPPVPGGAGLPPGARPGATLAKDGGISSGPPGGVVA